MKKIYAYKNEKGKVNLYNNDWIGLLKSLRYFEIYDDSNEKQKKEDHSLQES